MEGLKAYEELLKKEQNERGEKWSPLMQIEYCHANTTTMQFADRLVSVSIYIVRTLITLVLGPMEVGDPLHSFSQSLFSVTARRQEI